ncbi:MAG: winged helix-turn-helix domain-containing protein, partial [Rhodanobacteraceae bacterium]
MAAAIYRFRNFRLDPLARELYQDDKLVALPVSTLDCLIYLIRHRDRSVGRDELASAVWGRADVSEASLSHAIMRLRRLLGDTGNDQNSIRTVQRLGYRWIVEPTVEQSAEPPVVAPARAATNAGEAARFRRTSVWWIVALALFVAAFVVFGTIAIFSRSRGSSEARGEPAAAGRLPAMVLPADVAASSEWRWLRLGLMDLIANRLRKGHLATTPSETVVSLVNAHRLNGDRLIGGTRVLIRPHVEHAGGAWNVRLTAQADGREL